MNIVVKSSLPLLLLGLLCAAPSTALRMRGETYPGLAAAETRRPLTLSNKFGSRIVGGGQVAVGATPWVVSLQNQYGYHLCGGAIINKDWILTAASCVAGLRARNLMIVSGTVDWWSLTAPWYFVNEIHMHCNFDKPLYHNDIALLRLSDSIELNDVTKPIQLAEIDELEAGDNLKFAGWGSRTIGDDYPQLLHQIEGSYLPYKECREALGDTDDVDLGHVCVQMAVGQGMCHGDAGGPLINSNGQLVGVSNWGVPCGLGYPDVYARAAFYNDWIRTTINGCSQS